MDLYGTKRGKREAFNVTENNLVNATVKRLCNVSDI